MCNGSLKRNCGFSGPVKTVLPSFLSAGMPHPSWRGSGILSSSGQSLGLCSLTGCPSSVPPPTMHFP